MSQISWNPLQIHGSLYQTIKEAAEAHLKVDPDWIFLHNMITGETLMAQEALDMSAKSVNIDPSASKDQSMSLFLD